MATSCPHCQQARNQAHAGGRYAFSCIDCCARLVASARPLRAMQEAHLAAIARFERSPSREQILEHIRNNPQPQTRGTP